MKIYSTYYKKEDGTEEHETFHSLPAAKKWMKERPGSTGSITKVWCNGDWEPCGPILLTGSNAVQMSNEKSPNYR